MKLGLRRCISDANLYWHESGKLRVLAYADDLLVIGTDDMKKSFMSQLSEEMLPKETGKAHSLESDCDRMMIPLYSIDVCMSQTYRDSILELYGMKNAKPVATTGTVTIVNTVPDTPLSPEEHSAYRIAVGMTSSRSRPGDAL